MRARLAIVVMMAAGGCEKKAPRYDGPLRVEFGDCAVDPAWVSGPRPLPIVDKVAAKDPPEKPDDPDPKTTAGVLGSTTLQEGGAFASLTGTGDISSGFDDTNIYGGLLGNEAGEINGGFGYGRSGFGPGGGGTGLGTIGTGRYGTIGRGSGTGGYGVGGRRSAVPTVSIGQPNAQGDLDKAIIRRYIKRNIQKIQYCYEKQLLAKPTLAGTVQTQFFIAPTGQVASASANGVDPDVSSCIANVIKGIEFPKPKGGGGVQVNYPFTLRPADGNGVATPRTALTSSVGQGSGDLGGYQADEIDRVVKARAGVYRACYQKELAKQPNLAGKVVVRFEIDGEGTVTKSDIAAGTTMPSDDVKQCIARNIIRLKFPPKGATANVTYPFVFATDDSSAVAGAGSGSDTWVSADPKPDKPAPQPKPAPPAARYKPGANNPLVSQSAAIEDCLRTNPKHYGAVVVGIDWGAAGVLGAKVDGVADDVAECIANIAKTVPRPAAGSAKTSNSSLRCGFAFGTMPVEDLPSIEITATSVNVNGAPVASNPAVLRDETPTFKIEALVEKLSGIVKTQKASTGPVAIEGPMALRPIDSTPIKLFNKVISSAIVADVDFVLAVQRDGAWKLLDPVMFPAVPVPRGTGGMWHRHYSPTRGLVGVDDEHVVLSILVQKDVIWVGLSRVNEFTEVKSIATGPDFEKLATQLKQQKASAFFADRTDVELAGEGCTYGELARAIEVARDVGFVDFQVTTPVGLSARPTL